jgi:hypothetical protein
MQSNDPVQRAHPEAGAPPQQPSHGGSGEGAASAYARMTLQREQQAGQQPAAPEPEVEPV